MALGFSGMALVMAHVMVLVMALVRARSALAGWALTARDLSWERAPSIEPGISAGVAVTGKRGNPSRSESLLFLTPLKP